jgi:branched-chain amino acid transport system substrate-binding protein
MVSALAENAAGIVTQARQLGWNVPVMGGNGFNSPAFIKNAGPAAEGVYVGTAWNKVSEDPANQAFLKVMQAKGVDPDQFCAQAYTGVLVIAEAVKLSGTKGGRDDIKSGFAKVKDLPTPLGKFSFLENRDGNHPPSVQQVKDGKFQIVQ